MLDYGAVLLSLLPVERRSSHLYSYICELSLLCSPLALPAPARLASAILLLTRALHNYGTITYNMPKTNLMLRLEAIDVELFFSTVPVWPAQLEENTGFSKQDLVSCALSLYIKWYVSMSVFECF